MRSISPELEAPAHFSIYAERLQRALVEVIRFAISAPPQHGKTALALHALVFAVLTQPKRRHAYVTYNVQRTRKVARAFIALARLAGVEVSGDLETVYIRIKGADLGCVRFVSFASGLTGDPIDGLCLIDDPYKDEQDAASKLVRERVEQVWRTTIIPRLHPTASVVAMSTRWHPNDLIATFAAEGFEYVNLPAVAEVVVRADGVEEPDPNGRAPGEPLWPSQRPLDFLKKQRLAMLPLAWAQIYQGRPRLRGAGVFKAAHYYRELPKSYAAAFGLDLAYTESTKADWAVLLELWREENRVNPEQPLFYLPPSALKRTQVEVGDFADSVLGPEHRRCPNHPILWRCSGTERGSAQLLKRPPYNVPILLRQPPGDKYVSATPVAVAWNQGRILLPDPAVFPEAASWVPGFVGRVQDFTGAKSGEVDDDVDALGNAYTILNSIAHVEAARERQGAGSALNTAAPPARRVW